MCTSQSDILKQLGMTLWKQLTHLVLLTEQMRVTDKVYRELLNRLREGESTMNDFIVLSSRVVGNSLRMGSISMNDPIVVPGNKLRREMNNLFITHYSTFCKVFVSKATDSCKRGKLSDEHKEIMKILPCTQSDGLPGELPLFVGMPVFLTKNVSTDLGLTNGTTGIIHQIALQSSERVEDTLGVQALSYLPQYVVLECNDLLMNPLNGLLPNHVPILPVDGVFSIRKTATHERLTISRKQFPLEPAFSSTPISQVFKLPPPPPPCILILS